MKLKVKFLENKEYLFTLHLANQDTGLFFGLH